MPGARRHALRDAPRSHRCRRRSRQRRPTDAEPLGTSQPARGVAVEPHGHAGAASSGLCRGRHVLRRRRRAARDQGPLRTRRGGLRFPRRRHHQRGRILGRPEYGELHASARALPHRGQRLRHLRAGGEADRRRRHLAPGARLPRSPRPGCGRRRSTGELPGVQGSGDLLPRTPWSGAGPRPCHPSVRTLHVRRSRHVPFPRRTGRGEGPRRHPALRRHLGARRPGDGGGAGGASRRRRRGVARGRRPCRGGAEATPRGRSAARVFCRRSHQHRLRPPGDPGRRPGFHGGTDQPLPAHGNGARPAPRRLRPGRGRLRQGRAIG